MDYSVVIGPQRESCKIMATKIHTLPKNGYGNENSTTETKEGTAEEDKASSTKNETNKRPVREHPCKHLIDNFQIPSSCLVTVNEIKGIKTIEKIPCQFVSTKARLSELVMCLMWEKEIGIVVKYNMLSYRPRLCLILISCKSVNYMIDCIALKPNLHMLGDVFTNPFITKVTCDAMNTVKSLQLDENLWFVNVFDIKLAMQKLGMTKSFEKFIKFKYHREPRTSYQLNKWHIRPLPKNCKFRALFDMRYLIPAYYIFKNKLIVAKLLEPLLRDCNQLCGKVYQPDSIEMAFSNMQYLTPSQVYAIYALEAWRRKIGKKKRINVNAVLNIAKFKKLIDQMPSERLMIVTMAGSLHVVRHCKEVRRIFLRAKRVIGPVNSAGKSCRRVMKKAKKTPVTPASKRQNHQKLQDQKNKAFGSQKPIFKAGRERGGGRRGRNISAYSPEVFDTRPKHRTPPRKPVRPRYGRIDNRHRSQPRPRYPDTLHSPPRQFRERSRSPLFHCRSSRSTSPVRRDSSREYYRSNSPPLFQPPPRLFHSPPRQLRERSRSPRDSSREYYRSNSPPLPHLLQSPSRQLRERSCSPLFRHRSPPRSASPVRRDYSREYYRSDSPSLPHLVQSPPRPFQLPPRQLRGRSRSPLFHSRSPPRSSSPIRRHYRREYYQSNCPPLLPSSPRPFQSPPRQLRERSSSPLSRHRSPPRSASPVRRDSSREYYLSNSSPLPALLQSPPRQLRGRSRSPLFHCRSPCRSVSPVRRDSSREYYQRNSPPLFQSPRRPFQSPSRQPKERSNSPLFCRGSLPRNASPDRRDTSREYHRSNSPAFYSTNTQHDRPRQNPTSGRGVWTNDRDSRSDIQSQETCGSSLTRKNRSSGSGNLSRASRFGERPSFVSGNRSSSKLASPSSVVKHQRSSFGSRKVFVPKLW